MFERLLNLKPIRQPDGITASIGLISLDAVKSLLRTTARESVIRELPTSVSMIRGGEPEMALLSLFRTVTSPEGAKAVNLFAGARSTLKTYAEELTSAARILKFYPDKNLFRSISSGGIKTALEAEIPDDATSDERLAIRASTSINRDANSPIAATIQAMMDAARAKGNQPGGVVRNAGLYLEKLAYSVGRRPDVSDSVLDKSQAVKDRLDTIVPLTDMISDPMEAIYRYMVSLGYLTLHKEEEKLRFAGDFISTAFSRFFAVRLRDYAKFFSSVWAIERVLEIEAKIRTADSFLAMLGGQAGAVSDIRFAREDLERGRSSARVRIASVLRPWVTNTLDSVTAAMGCTNLIVSGFSFRDGKGVERPYVLPTLEGIINPRGIVTAGRGLPKSILVNHTDLIIGPDMNDSDLDSGTIAKLIAQCIILYRDATADLISLEVALPPLEEATQLLQNLPLLSAAMPVLATPRLISTGDDSTVAVGIRSSSIDGETGQVTEVLSPYINFPLNYTALSEHFYLSQPPLAYRLRALKTAQVGLPANIAQTLIPLNVLEGERPLVIEPSVFDLTSEDGSGPDVLRSIDAFLQALSNQERAYAICQLSASYAVLTPEPDLFINDHVEAMPIKGSKLFMLVPTNDEFTAYGWSTRKTLLQNLDAYLAAGYAYKAMLHPSGVVRMQLLPLMYMPAVRGLSMTYNYVQVSRDMMIPITTLLATGTARAPFAIKYERAVYTPMRAANHGQQWDTVSRWPIPAEKIHVGSDGRVYVWRDQTAGYLDPKEVYKNPSPWKAPDTIVEEAKTPIIEAPVMPSPTITQDVPLTPGATPLSSAAPEGEEMKDV